MNLTLALTRTRTILFGAEWKYFLNAVLGGVLCLIALGAGVSLSPAFRILLLVFVLFPVSIWLGYVDGGIVSTWILIFLPVAFAWPHGCTASGDGVYMCASQTSASGRLLFGLQVALIVGTIGYVLGRQ